MSLELANWILRIAAAYLLLGLLFGLPFVALGAGRLDPAARGAGMGFRLLILPGSIALWPILAWRLLRSDRAAGPSSTRLHRRQRMLVYGLALVLPLGFAMALRARPELTTETGLPADFRPAVPESEIAGPWQRLESAERKTSDLPGARIRLRRDAAGRGWLELEADPGLLGPDRLVYWQRRDPIELLASPEGLAGAVSPAAWLLGSLPESEGLLPLPPPSADEAGFVLVYDGIAGRTLCYGALLP
jgi:hypothetical protein